MPKRRGIPSLTGIRFFAALFVLVAHTDGYFADLQPAWLEYGWRIGANLGMMTFFVLSGFVIHYNYGHAITAGGFPAIASFVIARFARLYPLYLFAFFVGAAITPATFSTEPFIHYWPLFLTLTQDWSPGAVKGQYLAYSLVGGAWSISAEVGLYIFFLLAAPALVALHTVRATLYMMAVLTGAALLFFGGHTVGIWFSALADQSWWFDLSPWCRVPEFLLGALVAQLYLVVSAADAGIKINARWTGFVGVFWIVCSFLLCYRYVYWQAAFGFAPGIAAIMFFPARYRSKASAVFEAPVVTTLGNASYSIYLLHGFILHLILHDASRVMTNAILQIAAAWSLVVFLSVGSYACFEVPARRFIRRLSSYGTAASTAI